MNFFMQQLAQRISAWQLIGVLLLLGAVDLQAQVSIEPIHPGPRAAQVIQQQLDAHGIAWLGPGVFKLTSGLRISRDNIYLKGSGKYKTMLSFEHQYGPEPGILIQSSNVTIEGISLLNSQGHGLSLRSASSILLKDLRVQWDPKSPARGTQNAITIIDSEDILMRDVEAEWAGASGLHTRQTTRLSVENSVFTENTIGVHLEASTWVDIITSSLSSNSIGLLVNNIQSQPIEFWHIRLTGSKISQNNKKNSLPRGHNLSQLAQGIGVLLKGTNRIELSSNLIEQNFSAGVFLMADRHQSPPIHTSIRENIFTANGWSPDLLTLDLDWLLLAEKSNLADIVWDGKDDLLAVMGLKQPADVLHLQDNETLTYLNLDLHRASWRWLHRPTRTFRGNRKSSLPFFTPVTLKLDQYR